VAELHHLYMAPALVPTQYITGQSFENIQNFKIKVLPSLIALKIVENIAKEDSQLRYFKRRWLLKFLCDNHEGNSHSNWSRNQSRIELQLYQNYAAPAPQH
jgi:hypothetical protein